MTQRAAGFRTGVDVRRLNQLNDELQSEAPLDELARDGDRAVIVPALDLLV